MDRSNKYSVTFIFNPEKGFVRKGLEDVFDGTFSSENLAHDTLDHCLRDEKGNLEDKGTVKDELFALGYVLAFLTGSSNNKEEFYILEHGTSLFQDVSIIFCKMLREHNFSQYVRNTYYSVSRNNAFLWLKGCLLLKKYYLQYGIPEFWYDDIVNMALSEMYGGYISCIQEYKNPQNFFNFSEKVAKKFTKIINDFREKNLSGELSVTIDVSKKEVKMTKKFINT